MSNGHKCYVEGCDNEIDYIENSFGIHYCQECEKMFIEASLKDIDISSCKTKNDLINKLKNKT